ncbi:MAG: NADH pyrophosphatase, partial [Sphingomonadales bacterium]
MPLPLGFTGAGLDRADQLRTNVEAFAAATTDPRALCLVLDGIDFVPGESGGLLWEPLDPADERALMLLGIDDDGVPHFVREAPASVRIDARSRTVMRLLPLL